MEKQIINSIIDNDLYKFTMQWAVMSKFPNAIVEYEFINRGNNSFPEDFDVELINQISLFKNLKLTDEEQNFILVKCPFLPNLYIDFLKGYTYNPNEVSVYQKENELKIKIKGPWYRVILWEVPLMALISELYFKKTNQNLKDFELEKFKDRDNSKINIFRNNNIKFADFGTRRRFSFKNQKRIIDLFSKGLLNKDTFIGTSNLHFAKEFNLKPIGTQAHEWFMFHGSKFGYKLANKISLENWVDVYKGDLGIALSDTLTTDIFFKSFDKKFAKLFDGVRHDSGDPFVFGNKVISHYSRLNIDPREKTIVFSDSLNTQKVIKLVQYFAGKIKISFGIGTNLTNDINVTPLNMVIKMTKAKFNINDNWDYTIKLSDDTGKHTGNKEEIKLAKQILKI